MRCVRYARVTVARFLLFMLATALKKVFLYNTGSLVAVFMTPRYFDLYSCLLSKCAGGSMQSGRTAAGCLLVNKTDSSVLIRNFS